MENVIDEKKSSKLSPPKSFEKTKTKLAYYVVKCSRFPLLNDVNSEFVDFLNEASGY